MEFPDLGQHCSEVLCRQIDFLPMKCDSCQRVFCKNHFTYSQHQCPSAYKKDVQVPVCPLCNMPVPIKRGDVPDVAVGAHIDNDCKSDPAVKKRKIYTNRCNKKGCKVKELIKVTCDRCHQNFCLTHRHPQDHECRGAVVGQPSSSRAGLAAMQRLQASQSALKSGKNNGSPGSVSQWSRNTGHTGHVDLQGDLSEDQALARAIQASLSEAKPMTQEEMDREIAQALAASDDNHQLPTRTQRSSNNCAMA